MLLEGRFLSKNMLEVVQDIKIFNFFGDMKCPFGLRVLIGCVYADLEIVKLLAGFGADLNQCTYKGLNGVHLAAEYGKEDIIEFLHSNNNQLIHEKCDKGETAVNYACLGADLKTVQLLEKLGADLNLTGYSAIATNGPIDIADPLF